MPATPGGEVADIDGPDEDTAMKVDSPTRVCICVDGSVLSPVLLTFVARHFPSALGAEVHLVCVAATQQLPVRMPLPRNAVVATAVAGCAAWNAHTYMLIGRSELQLSMGPFAA